MTNKALQKKAIKFDKESLNRFQKALNEAAKSVDDLSVPLDEISKKFLESRNFIFDQSRTGPGAYQDLSPNYKKQKQREHGFVYPILFATGRLKKSLTKKGGENITIIGKKSLEIGTEVPYANALQYGKGNKMPKRTMLFWGPESPKFATNKLVRKQNKAMAVSLLSFIERKLGKQLKASIKTAERKADKLFRNT